MATNYKSSGEILIDKFERLKQQLTLLKKVLTDKKMTAKYF